MFFGVFGEVAWGCYWGGGAGGGAFIVGDQAFLNREFRGAGVVWIIDVVLVDDGMDHDCLFVNRQC